MYHRGQTSQKLISCCSFTFQVIAFETRAQLEQHMNKRKTDDIKNSWASRKLDPVMEESKSICSQQDLTIEDLETEYTSNGEYTISIKKKTLEDIIHRLNAWKSCQTSQSYEDPMNSISDFKTYCFEEHKP